MQQMRRSRWRSNRLALHDEEPSTVTQPPPYMPPLPLRSLPESPRDAAAWSDRPPRSGSPPLQPPSFPAPQPASRNTHGAAANAYESLGHATGGQSGAVAEGMQHDDPQRAHSSSTVVSGHQPESPTALVASPPGVLATHRCPEPSQCLVSSLVIYLSHRRSWRLHDS
jgi:hypothetical protein